MKRKSNFLRLSSLLVVLSLILTSGVFAEDNTTEPDKWAIPDVISATLESLDITVSNDIVASGSVKVGNQSFSFSSQIELYQIESEDTQNGKCIANILSSNGYSLLNLSVGSPSATLVSKDENVLSAENVTRIALLDKEHNRIFSAEQPSDYIHVTTIREHAQLIDSSDDLYETLIQNESWYNNIIRQEIRNSTEFQIVDENEIENVNKRSSEALTDQWVDPAEARQEKSDYETLKAEESNVTINLVNQSAAAALSSTFSPKVDSAISACVNYVGLSKFKNANTIYQRTPTSSDPTGYYMETAPIDCDYTWCIQNNPNCKPVQTWILGYQIVNMAPKDDANNSSYTFIRLDIIWSYYIIYYPCHNHIELIFEDSGLRLRNIKLAMNTDEDSTDFFYRMFANAKTRNGMGTISNPAVNLALKAIPGGQYVNMGINVWNALYTVASSVTANGANGSADKSWSSVPSTHQSQMYALTGTSGYNRLVNVDCLQSWDDKWLSSKGHYIYLDAYVQSTGPVRKKWMQYSYKFEICTQNVINYFYTIQTVNNFFYRSYCR